MDIEKALFDEGLDIRLRKEYAPHSWYGHMEFEAAQLCAELEESTYFTFNCDQRLQAYAVYSSRLVRNV